MPQLDVVKDTADLDRPQRDVKERTDGVECGRVRSPDAPTIRSPRPCRQTTNDVKKPKKHRSEHRLHPANNVKSEKSKSSRSSPRKRTKDELGNKEEMPRLAKKRESPQVAKTDESETSTEEAKHVEVGNPLQPVQVPALRLPKVESKQENAEPSTARSYAEPSTARSCDIRSNSMQKMDETVTRSPVGVGLQNAAENPTLKKVSAMPTLNAHGKSATSSGLDGDIRITEGFKSFTVVHFFLMLMATLIPNLMLVMIFSHIGNGLVLYNAMASKNMNYAGTALIFFAFLLCTTLYILDIMSWSPPLKVVWTVIPFGCVCGACVLKARAYPFFPIVLTVFFIPLLSGGLRATICRRVVRAKFYKWFFICAMFSAIFVLLLWLAWVFKKSGENKWEEPLKLKMVRDSADLFRIYKINDPLFNKERDLSYDLDCGPNKDMARFSREDKTKIGEYCRNTMTVLFVIWSSPLAGCCGAAFLGLVAFMNGVMLGLKSGDDAKRLESTLKKWLGLLVFIFMGMYVATSISGANWRLGGGLMAFFAAALTVLVVSMYVELGKYNMQEHLKRSDLAKMMMKFGSSDWARAVFIGGLNGWLPFFLCCNMLKQRLKIACGGEDVDQGERFTPFGRKLFDTLRSWNWVSILLKICLLGELFFTFQVGVSKATYIFLSWLNKKLADYSYSVVIAVIFVIGYIMFLLPPVPGVPVYVFCGIVVAEQGRQLDSVGFGLGCAIACALAWLLKLAACTGQYGIGFCAGKWVKVQQLIGVDKVPTRAIEKLLKEKGLGVGKVAVLVGGPDWPTSVTCGILKLNVPQMLLGTAPVFLVSSPCVLAGAFLARVTVGEASIWSALASTFLGLSAAGQMASMFMAVACITKVIENHGEELAKPRQEHEAIACLTRREAAFNSTYAEVTSWVVLHPIRKIVICTAAGVHLLSGFIFAFGGRYCFRPFAVSSDIGAPYEDSGLNGNAINIVLPVGYGALGLFAVGVLFHIIFAKDSTWLATREMKRKQAAGETVLPDEVQSRGLLDTATVLGATSQWHGKE